MSRPVATRDPGGPAERLTSCGAPRRAAVAHLVALAGVALVPALVPDRFELFNAQLLGVYVVAALGLNVALHAGLLSAAQGALLAVGAYTVAVATGHGWSYWAAFPVAVVLSGAVALALVLPALRLGVYTLAMITLGYATVAQKLALEWRGLTGGGNGLSGLGFPAPFATVEASYWLVAGTAVAAYGLAHNLLRSPLGREAAAVRDQPMAAESLGVRSVWVRARSFAVSGAFAGGAGALYAPLLGFVAPDAFSVDLALLFLLMVLVGGSGTVVGPVLGALVVFRIPLEVERLTNRPGEWSALAYAAALLLVVYLLPRGLVSGWRRLAAARAPGTPGRVARAGPAFGPLLERSDGEEEPALRAVGVSKQLGGVAALSGAGVGTARGAVHALIGPNGSGKTTLLNCLSGFVAPDRGRVELSGRDVSRWPAWRRARAGVGRTFQTPLVFDSMSCLENVLVAVDRRRRRGALSYLLRLPGARREEAAQVARARVVLSAAGLGHRAHDPARHLTTGERRLLELARIAAQEPFCVLMDEPAAGLSDEEVAELEAVIRDLRAAGVAVLLVEHRAALVMRLSDEVTVLDNGCVLARGTPEAVRGDERVVAAYLGRPRQDGVTPAQGPS